MYNWNSSVIVINCIFVRNSAVIGGGMYDVSYGSLVTNCTFWHNSASSSGAMDSSSTSLTVTNCIFWGDSDSSLGSEFGPGYPFNPTVTHSIIAGGYPGAGNLDVDPLLNPDLTLQPGSPAIDSGGCGANVTTTDIFGNPRWDIASAQDASGSNGVDIGAYEYQGVAGTDNTIANVTCP